MFSFQSPRLLMTLLVSRLIAFAYLILQPAYVPEYHMIIFKKTTTMKRHTTLNCLGAFNVKKLNYCT